MIADLAGALADGETVDWEGLDRRLQGPREKALAQAMRALSTLATPGLEAGSWPDRLPRWPWPCALRAFVLVAALQVGLVPLGLVLGHPNVSPVSAWLQGIAVLALAGGATLLLLGGGRDRRAVLLGATLLSGAAACGHRFGSWLGPAPNGLDAPWIAFKALLPESFTALLFWLFVREFPRVVRLGRSDQLLRHGIRATGALGSLTAGAHLAASLWNPAAPDATPFIGWLSRQHPDGVYWVVSFGGVLPALALACWRTRDAPRRERGRVALFLAAVVLGLAPMIVSVTLEYVYPPFGRLMDQPDARRLGSVVVYACLCSMPFATAWSVLTQRVLTVRVALGLAARSLLARSTLWAGQGLLAALLISYLYVHRQSSLAALLGGLDGVVLQLALGAGGLLLLGRRFVLRQVESLLLGRRHSPEFMVDALAANSRQARSLGEFCSLALPQIGEAMGAGPAVLLLHDKGTGTYRQLSATPLRPLPADSALAALACDGLAPLPVVAGRSRSLFEWLPEEDRQWLDETRLELLLPVAGTHGQPLGLMGLGPRRGELPYTQPDLQILSALAASTGLAVENWLLREHGGLSAGRPAEAQRAAAQCPACGSVRAAGPPLCPCGGRLAEASIPLVLGGKFRVEAVLGQGGMGVVYRAVDLALGRGVALKTLPRVSSVSVQRLREEARSMAGFVHPHLAVIFGVESWRGVPVLVVEYLAGGTLATRLRAGPLPWSEVVAHGAALAGALEAMHAAGLAHRDIKPSNVGFTAEGVPKLLDFGLARLADAGYGIKPRPHSGEFSSSQGLVGTLAYLSPEAVDGAPPGPAQDLWALALSLYESIAGLQPLAAPDVETCLALLRSGRVPDLRQLRPETPAPVAAFFAQALHQRRDRRPRSAAALRDCLAGLLAVAESPGRPVRETSPAR